MTLALPAVDTCGACSRPLQRMDVDGRSLAVFTTRDGKRLHTECAGGQRLVLARLMDDELWTSDGPGMPVNQQDEE